jgi:homoserine kinase type II
MYARWVAILTPLGLVEARRLGAEFGLEVVSVEGILAGSVNSNFQLGIAGGQRAFLRIYEEQDAEAAAEDVRLIEHLAARGVPTPRVLPLVAGGGSLARYLGKPVAVFPWIDGEIVCQARVTPARTHAVGIALAQMHVAAAGYPARGRGRFGPPQLSARLDSLAAAPHVADAARLLRERLDALPPQPEPRGVIHGDLFRDNVLWAPAPAADVRALLDFESASLGSFAFDLAVTALAWCFGTELQAELVSALARGYRSVRPLDGNDLDELPAQARFAAIRFSITRITDFELRPREAGIYKDYRRFLARLAALDTLGDDGVRRLFAS